jgi:hypothetical protein
LVFPTRLHNRIGRGGLEREQNNKRGGLRLPPRGELDGHMQVLREAGHI